MRYVTTRFKTETREMAYRFYVTDALKIIAKNTASLGGGEYIKERFYDGMSGYYSNKKLKVETRNADEIKADIKQKIKLLGGG